MDYYCTSKYPEVNKMIISFAKERGMDVTNCGVSKMELYNSMSRCSFTADEDDYWIVHDWETPIPTDEKRKQQIKVLEEKIENSKRHHKKEMEENQKKLSELRG